MNQKQRKHFRSANGDLAMASAHLENAARSLLRAAAEADALATTSQYDRMYTTSLLDTSSQGLTKASEKIAEMSAEASAYRDSVSE